jgi:hypothetical protein
MMARAVEATQEWVPAIQGQPWIAGSFPMKSAGRRCQWVPLVPSRKRTARAWASCWGADWFQAKMARGVAHKASGWSGETGTRPSGSWSRTRRARETLTSSGAWPAAARAMMDQAVASAR